MIKFNKKNIKLVSLILTIAMLFSMTSMVSAIDEVIVDNELVEDFLPTDEAVDFCCDDDAHIESNVFDEFSIMSSSCPRGCGGSLVDGCSGQPSHIDLGTCATGLTGHPFNCQVIRQHYFSSQRCSRNCGYSTTGSSTHWHSYSHTLGDWSGSFCG